MPLPLRAPPRPQPGPGLCRARSRRTVPVRGCPWPRLPFARRSSHLLSGLACVSRRPCSRLRPHIDRIAIEAGRPGSILGICGPGNLSVQAACRILVERSGFQPAHQSTCRIAHILRGMGVSGKGYTGPRENADCGRRLRGGRRTALLCQFLLLDAFCRDCSHFGFFRMAASISRNRNCSRHRRHRLGGLLAICHLIPR